MAAGSPARTISRRGKRRSASQRPGYRRLGALVAAHGVQENTHVGEPPLKYRMIANITDEQLILPRAMQECKLRGG